MRRHNICGERFVKILSLLLFASIAVQAQQITPLEVKEIRLGVAGAPEVMERFPGALVLKTSILVDLEFVAREKCGPSMQVNECRLSAMDDLRLAGATVGTYYFYLLDDKVESVSVSFHINGYKLVRDALTVKYGKPTDETINTVQSRAGASFQSESLSWNRADGNISLVERSAEIERSAVVMSTKKYLTHTEEREKRQSVEGAQKL